MSPARTRRRIGWTRTLTTAVMIGAAAVALTPLVAAAGEERLGYDFRLGYLDAAHSVREVGSPYSSLEAADDLEYVYPPQLALALVPLTVLPDDVVVFVGFLGALASLLGALALVGVRDVRCYAAAVLWAPGWNAIEMANVSALLALGLACAWRYRDTKWPLATSLGLVVSTKLFLWPLLVWVLAARRVRAAVAAVAIGLVVTIAAWAAIGFRGLTSFPERLDTIEFQQSYSLVGMTSELGLDASIGRLLTVVVGGAFIGATILLGRRGDDARAFTCAIAAALALTPVVWMHYFVLFVVPLAIARPRFSALWLLPIVLWVSPRAGNGDGYQVFAPALVAGVLLAFMLMRPRPAAAVAEAF